jgi:hypothetical protein
VKNLLVGSPFLRIHAPTFLASSRRAALTLQLMVCVLSRVARAGVARSELSTEPMKVTYRQSERRLESALCEAK